MASDDFYDDGIELSETQVIVACVIAGQEQDAEVAAAIARLHAEVERSGWEKLEEALLMFEHPGDDELEDLDYEIFLREWDAAKEPLQ